MKANTLKVALLALPLIIGLSGCVLVVDGNKSSQETRQSQQNWEVEQERNLRNINTLSHGQSVNQVISTMGHADFDENIRIADTQYRVLYYRTHHVKADGKTTKDECTPIVFRDGELYGWGENQLKVLLSSAN